MGKDYCSIKGCHNTRGIVGRFGKNVKLHHLPKKQSLRSAWLRAISRSKYKWGHFTFVCSDHFPDGEGRTWKHDVPSLFLPQKKEKVVNKRTTKNSTDTTKLTKSDAETALRLSNFLEENKDEIVKAVSEDLDIDVNSARVLLDHQYSMNSEAMENMDAPAVDTGTGTQTLTGLSSIDQGVEVQRPEIAIEDIMDSDEDIQFYTGLPDYHTFKALFDSLIDYGMDSGKSDQRIKLRLVDEFLMVLMRVRLGLLVKDLAYRFKISSTSVSRIFFKWITFMRQALSSLVFLPDLKVLQRRVPGCFQKFPDSRIILDCTEVFIQTPSSLENKSQTYSNYKSHNTFKALVGISMTGATCLVSKLWGGSASDVHITRNCGLLQQLRPGDAVMVDKGFIHIKGDLDKKNVKLYCPPFKTKNQFTKEEVELTRRIASARIHVERKMEQIKNFRLLQGILPLALAPITDDIFFVCAALTNLMPPLVSQ